MKPISQIARECHVCYDTIKSIVRKEGIVSVVTDGRINYYDIHQEAYIVDVLSQTREIKRDEFEIYPSRMNRKDFVNDWEQNKFNEFKRKTYNKNL